MDFVRPSLSWVNMMASMNGRDDWSKENQCEQAIDPTIDLRQNLKNVNLKNGLYCLILWMWICSISVEQSTMTSKEVVKLQKFKVAHYKIESSLSPLMKCNSVY